MIKEPRSDASPWHVLCDVQSLLQDHSETEISRLLKIWNRLAECDTNTWTPADTASWAIRSAASREKRLEKLSMDLGYSNGFSSGLRRGMGLGVFAVVCIILIFKVYFSK